MVESINYCVKEKGHENPVVARFVDYEEDYPYSSAVDYSGQKGLVEIVKMY